MSLPAITIQGTAVADPELRFTQQGTAVANVRVASNSRKKMPDGTWQDGDATFLTVTAWKQQAENMAQSVKKGDRIVVVGRLKQSQFTGKDGTEKTTYEVDADEVAVSLLFATLSAAKSEPSGGVPF